MSARVETVVASRTLHSPWTGEHYPGLRAVRPGPGWHTTIVVVFPGQTVEARGGEYAYAFDLPGGAHADRLDLAAGDRATMVRADLPGALAEWRVARA